MFQAYLQELKMLLDQFQCTSGPDNTATVDWGVAEAIGMLDKAGQNNRKLLWVGNGGSAAIVSHSAADYFRTGNFRTLCFSDSSLLTCLSNDFGYPEVFAKPVAAHAEAGDILVAISSSGRSANILNAVDAARGKGCLVITLSGFDPDNPLRTRGDVNFYVPSREYGYVELIHGVLCHSILDLFMKKERGLL